MRITLKRALVLSAAVLFLGTGQVAAQAAATGTCKDGTTTSSEGKRGACKGHGGVKDWYADKKTGASDKTAPAAKTAKSAAAAPAPAPAPAAAPAAEQIKCTDGSTWTGTRKGACRGHGGIASAKATAAAAAKTATPAAPAPAPAPAAAMKASKATAPAPAAKAAVAPTGPAPEGATAVCKDGTYSKSKQHSGSCSRHGGVEKWLTPAK